MCAVKDGSDRSDSIRKMECTRKSRGLGLACLLACLFFCGKSGSKQDVFFLDS